MMRTAMVRTAMMHTGQVLPQFSGPYAVGP